MSITLVSGVIGSKSLSIAFNGTFFIFPYFLDFSFIIRQYIQANYIVLGSFLEARHVEQDN